MSIERKSFGMHDGKEVFSYTLDNKKGLTAEIITYGGILRRLIYNGTDVVLGRDSLEEYLENNGCYGALIGRNSNRIENSEFELNGKVYKLNPNNGRNNLHGGLVGFNKRVWESEATDGAEPALKLSLISPDGEEGFPGNVTVTVTYTLTCENGIKLHYEAISDSDTVVNLTNHSYFNLNGHSSGVCDNHTLWLGSSFFTPNTDECMPYGEVWKSAGTPFDFTAPKTLGEGFASDYEQIKMFGGFDHNLALDGRGLRLAATLTGDKTGITMDMYTDQSAVQLYTGNMIQEGRVCKDGAVYSKHCGICLETQAFPNSLKYSHYPNGILKKGEKYDTVTEYRFR